MITLQKLSEILNGCLSQGDKGKLLAFSVNTDTRTVKENDLFFALKGENFDGNHYARQAAEKGAAVVITSEKQDNIPESCGQIVVKDTVIALQECARYYRNRFPDLHVIGITGSNGKTSTKDFLKAILAQKGPCSATQGNLNNHIGLPLSVLKLTNQDYTAVWEMGMNHPGELSPLCTIAQPQIGIITCIGTAHIEYMGSRQGIADEKAELARTLPATGTFIMPATDEFATYISKQTKASIILVGDETSPIRAENIQATSSGNKFTLIIDSMGQIEIDLPVPGHHMVKNALLAAAAAHTLNYSLEEIKLGLSSSQLTQGRLQKKQFGSITVLDDTYNANPDSMKAALLTLHQMERPVPTSKKIAILGNMGELGPFTEEGHKSVGQVMSGLDLDILVTVGDKAAFIAQGASSLPHLSIIIVDDNEAALTWLKDNIQNDDILLFKGSRSSRMETIISHLF